MKRLLYMSVALASGAFAPAAAFGAWTFDSAAGTLSDGAWSFPAKVVNTVRNAAGESVTGIQIVGAATAGAGDVDFTGFVSDEGYKVISITADKVVNGITDSPCTRFVAPDAFHFGVSTFSQNKDLSEIVISNGVTELPNYFASEAASLAKLTPTAFPHVTKDRTAGLLGLREPRG